MSQDTTAAQNSVLGSSGEGVSTDSASTAISISSTAILISSTAIPISSTAISISSAAPSFSTRANSTPTQGGGHDETSPVINDGHTDKIHSSGGEAGLAVGMLLLGALIASLIAFFLMRRRRRHKNTPPPMGHPQQHGAYNVPAVTVIPQFSQFLLDATPDREITSELRSLRDLIQQHVENNYHLQPVPVNPSALVQVLSDLGVGRNGSLSPHDVANYALDARTRHATIQHVLSEVILGAADFNSGSQFSLLPPAIASFTHSIPPVEPKTGDHEVTSSILTKWRTMTAFLLHPSRSQRTTLTPDEASLLPQITTLTNALNTFLEPFVEADPSSRFQQTNHLKAVIFECAKLGYTLFSQPGDWALVHRPRAGARCLVTCPGAEKVSDKDGNPYPGGSRLVEEPTTMPL